VARFVPFEEECKVIYRIVLSHSWFSTNPLVFFPFHQRWRTETGTSLQEQDHFSFRESLINAEKRMLESIDNIQPGTAWSRCFDFLLNLHHLLLWVYFWWQVFLRVGGVSSFSWFAFRAIFTPFHFREMLICLWISFGIRGYICPIDLTNLIMCIHIFKLLMKPPILHIKRKVFHPYKESSGSV